MKAQKNKIKEFKDNKAVIGALAMAFDKSFITIERWMESNDDRLTSDKAKKVFEEYEAKTGQPV
jgi:hypothetical protein